LEHRSVQQDDQRHVTCILAVPARRQAVLTPTTCFFFISASAYFLCTAKRSVQAVLDLSLP
jgi:hypothetical protein